MNTVLTIPATDYDRRVFLGSSDIASVLGLQPQTWRTAVGTWQRKVQDEPDEPHTDRAKRRVLARGHVVEPLVQKMLAELYDIPELRLESVSNVRYIDRTLPWAAAEIDFQVPLGAVRHLFRPDDVIGAADDEMVNVEIKTVHPFAASEWGEEGSEDIPVHYAAQMYWALGVTGRRFAICAALFGADDLVLYPIVADAETIAGMRDRAVVFWQHVTDRTPPPVQTVGDTLALWPRDNGEPVQATEDIVAAVRTLRAMKSTLSSYENGADGITVFVRDYMKDATTLVDGGTELATLKSQRTTSIDQEKLKSEFPEAYKACRREGTTRVLRLKEKA